MVTPTHVRSGSFRRCLQAAWHKQGAAQRRRGLARFASPFQSCRCVVTRRRSVNPAGRSEHVFAPRVTRGFADGGRSRLRAVRRCHRSGVRQRCRRAGTDQRQRDGGQHSRGQTRPEVRTTMPSGCRHVALAMGVRIHGPQCGRRFAGRLSGSEHISWYDSVQTPVPDRG